MNIRMAVWMLGTLPACDLYCTAVQAQSLVNTGNYCDELGPGYTNPCTPGISVSAPNSAPIVFTGAYGGVTSTVTYDTIVAEVSTTGYITPASWSGSGGGTAERTVDTVTISGGSGSASGVMILTLSQFSTSPGPVDFSTGGLVDNNPYQEAAVSVNPAIGSPDTWPGGGWSADFSQSWQQTSSPQISTSFSGSSSATYNPLTQQIIVPFTFVYGVAAPLSVNANLQSNDGAVAQVNASLTFQLPAGATLTAASGTQYPVTYSGSNPGNSVDAPLPLWAMVALGCALLILSLRRQSGRG
jgi:hypothetical protein